MSNYNVLMKRWFLERELSEQFVSKNENSPCFGGFLALKIVIGSAYGIRTRGLVLERDAS